LSFCTCIYLHKEIISSFGSAPFYCINLIKEILKDNKTKSLNHEFETISRSDGTDYGKLANTHHKVYATKNYQITSKDGWLEITDPSIIDLIMKNYGDPVCRKILLCAIDTPRTITDILLTCSMPQTTGYRKILKMAEDQMLIPFDTKRKNGSKRTTRYIATFMDIRINITDKVVTISARPNLNAKIKSQINFLKHL
jgi:hypothetical protein